MAFLQDLEAATHHDDQQASDLCFDGSETAKHAANVAKNGGGQQREEPAALIPTVGAGRRLKHA